ncbi:MAG: hypothetical protein IKQ31_02035 [Clostridia bacterium]|nr:hypothetical protein [Clostridia bacterium]
MISDEKRTYDLGPKMIYKTEVTIGKCRDFCLNLHKVNEFRAYFVDTDKITLEVRTDLNIDLARIVGLNISNGRNKEINLYPIKQKGERPFDALGHIFVQIVFPNNRENNIEISGDYQKITLTDCPTYNHIEFDGTVNEMNVYNMAGYLEINSPMALTLNYDASMERVDINQKNTTSSLILTPSATPNIYAMGKDCDIVLVGCAIDPNSEKLIELNGAKSSLIVRCK